MAVLSKLRSHSITLLVVVGFAMAAFIIGDLLTSSGSILQDSRNKVVTINGKKITYEAYEGQRNSEAEWYKSIMGRSDISTEQQQQLNEQVYNEFVNGVLMDEASDEYGFDVTDDEFNELIQGDHVSPVLRQIFTNPQNGQYMSDAVSFWVNMVANNSFDQTAEMYAQQGAQLPAWANRRNWDVVEKQIKLTRKMEKYSSLMRVAVAPNKLEAKNYFNGENMECNFAFVKKDESSVADSLVNVSEKDLKAIYDANLYNFKANESRSIDYIAVQVFPSQEDRAALLHDMDLVKEEFSTADDVTELVNSNSLLPYNNVFIAASAFDPETKSFIENNSVGAVVDPTEKEKNFFVMTRLMDKKTAPDSLKVAFMLVESAKADSLEKVTTAANFEATAKANSAQPQLAAANWYTELAASKNFGNELANEIFAKGNGNNVYRKNLDGVTVFYTITEATKPVLKAKVAIYAQEATASSATRRDAYGKLNNFLTANKTIQQMKDSAAANGYTMLPTDVYSETYNVGPVADARQAVRFAFQGKVNDISEIYENGDYLLVVGIDAINKAGYMPLDNANIHNYLNRRALSEKKVAKLASDMKATGATTLADYAAKMHADVDTAQFVNMNVSRVNNLGVEPAVVATALNAAEGTVVGPIEGKRSAVVLSVLSKRDKGLQFDEASAMASVNNSDYRITRDPFSILKKYAKIEDNRVSFY